MGVINLGALVEKLRKKMSGEFIEKTDYPSGDNAGVIKVDSTYATEVTSGGKLKAKEITAEAYSEANNGAFISKATLDNVLSGYQAGVSVTQLYSLPAEPVAVARGTDITLSATSAGYDFLVIVIKQSSGTRTTTILIKNTQGEGNDAVVATVVGTTSSSVSAGFTPNGTSLGTSASTSLNSYVWYAVYGVKL